MDVANVVNEKTSPGKRNKMAKRVRIPTTQRVTLFRIGRLEIGWYKEFRAKEIKKCKPN